MHSWHLTPEQALLLQKKMAGRVIQQDQPGRVTRVAGVDVCVRNDTAIAAVVVLSRPDRCVLETATAERRVTFPYVPGLLSFREGPVILDALSRLAVKPDLAFFDGQGVAHPRRFGLASHMGLLTGLPTIGCAKSRLCGRYDTLGLTKGSVAYLRDKGEIIGAAVRTRRHVKPLFISVGHRISLSKSIRYVLEGCTEFRLPETIRCAHRLAGGVSGGLNPKPTAPDPGNIFGRAY